MTQDDGPVVNVAGWLLLLAGILFALWNLWKEHRLCVWLRQF
jgi:hypothetical protein